MAEEQKRARRKVEKLPEKKNRKRVNKKEKSRKYVQDKKRKRDGKKHDIRRIRSSRESK